MVQPMAQIPQNKPKGLAFFNDDESEEEEVIKPVKKPLVENVLAAQQQPVKKGEIGNFPGQTPLPSGASVKAKFSNLFVDEDDDEDY